MAVYGTYARLSQKLSVNYYVTGFLRNGSQLYACGCSKGFEFGGRFGFGNASSLKTLSLDIFCDASRS